MSKPSSEARTSSAVIVHVPMFGEVSIHDGAIVAMDGGIHGVQGHTMTILPEGQSVWARRVDSFQPHGTPGSGKLELDADEVSRLGRLADTLWKLAPSGTAKFNPPIASGPPRWVWAIVLRRGDDVRVLGGGGNAPPEGAPDPAKQVLEFLVARVDASSAAAP